VFPRAISEHIGAEFRRFFDAFTLLLVQTRPLYRSNWWVGGPVAVQVALAATATALPSYQAACKNYWPGEKVKGSAGSSAAETA